MKEVSRCSILDLKLHLAIKNSVNAFQLCIGIYSLIFGVILYYFFRSAEHTFFLRYIGSGFYTNDIISPFLVPICNSLPTFIHVFAFSLITASFIARQKGGYIIVCLLWLGIDVAFEMGQILDYSMINIMPIQLSRFILGEHIRNYFLNGHFDYLDLLSIVLGSSIAYFILIATSTGRENHEKKVIHDD